MQNFSNCPACGYTRGFHVSFQTDERGHRIVLICPSCVAKFDVGWVVGGLADEVEQL